MLIIIIAASALLQTAQNAAAAKSVSKREVIHIPTFTGEKVFIPVLGNMGLEVTSNVGFGGLFGRPNYNRFYQMMGGNGYVSDNTYYPPRQPYTTTSWNPVRFSSPNVGQCQVIRYLGYQFGYPSYYCYCSNIGYFTQHMKTNRFGPCDNRLPTNQFQLYTQTTTYG